MAQDLRHSASGALSEEGGYSESAVSSSMADPSAHLAHRGGHGVSLDGPGASRASQQARRSGTPGPDPYSSTSPSPNPSYVYGLDMLGSNNDMDAMRQAGRPEAYMDSGPR